MGLCDGLEPETLVCGESHEPGDGVSGLTELGELRRLGVAELRELVDVPGHDPVGGREHRPQMGVRLLADQP